MTARAAATLLLIFSLAAHAAAHTRSAQDDEVARITPEEEREARALAVRFVERFRETNDIAPLISEFFIQDFCERLRQDSAQLPMLFVAPDAARQASADELRQFYVAEFNFFTLTLEYLMARERQKEKEEEEDDSDDDSDDDSPEAMFPTELFPILKSGLIFPSLAAEEKADPDESGEEAGESAAEGDRDAGFIKSDDDLRLVTSTVGRGVAILRRYVLPLTMLRHAQRDWISDEDHEEVHDPYVNTHEEEFYGFPAGTRFVLVTVEPVHDLPIQLCLVEDGGHLKILYAFPVLGD